MLHYCDRNSSNLKIINLFLFKSVILMMDLGYIFVSSFNLAILFQFSEHGGLISYIFSTIKRVQRISP